MMKVDIDNIKTDENGMVRLKDLQEAAMDDRLNEWQQLPSVIKVLTSYEMGHWLRRRQGRIEGKTIDRVLESIDGICDDFCTEELNCIPLITRVAEIRKAVETMKGGEQE